MTGIGIETGTATTIAMAIEIETAIGIEIAIAGMRHAGPTRKRAVKSILEATRCALFARL
jgi:hypothetical protein